MTKKQKHFLKNLRSDIIFHGVVLFIGVFMLYPLLWMMFGAFKPTAEIFGTISLIPKEPTLQNFVRGWAFNNSTTFTTFYKNSFIVTGLSTLGAVLASSLVAYGFSRIRFRGNKFWYGCMFLTLMLPYQVVMVPQFIIFYKLNWVNTFLPLIVPHWGGQAFFIFLMVQFIRGIPAELDQSAMIDGCNKFSIYTRIIFPLIKPALITSTIFSFYWRWEDFLGPLLYLNRPRNFTVSLALRMFSDPQSATDWGAIFAMGSLSLLPSLIIFLVFQKYIVEGIATSGLKV
ncbi:putative ABC transporter permease protein YesQ [Spirochaetia bacterium]|nr:putative ABC transporter permease protein YesQ [Spirochaetia bacterium]GHV54150.1 putative ABC transporter permease protein YesQ [Spirochaetia bacterium]